MTPLTERDLRRGRGKLVAAFQTTEKKNAYAAARGKHLGLSGSLFMRAVFNHWLMNGARPIDALEEVRGVVPVPDELAKEIRETNIFHP